MSLTNIFSNVTDLFPQINQALIDHFTNEIIDITYDDRIYNGTVILCFDGDISDISVYQKKRIMQKAYVYESAVKRVHHVIAINLKTNVRSQHEFDETSVLWQSSAGEQSITTHTNILTVLTELIQEHNIKQTGQRGHTGFLW
jgi:hypothetical protein